MGENINVTLLSEREQCELAEKRIWGWKERKGVMRADHRRHWRRIDTSRGRDAFPSHFPGCSQQTKPLGSSTTSQDNAS